MSPPRDAGPDDGGWTALRDALADDLGPLVQPDQIDRVFQRAQPPDAAPVTLAALRVGRRTDEPARDQIAMALEEARARGFDRAFAFALIDALPAPQRAVARVQALFDRDAPADAVYFEALANILQGFDHPDAVVVGMHRGRLNTCMIEIDGDAGLSSATGFLLRTDLALTSFHAFAGSGCIEPAGGATAATRFRQTPGARGRIRLTFNNFRNPALGDRRAGSGVAVELAEDWLAAASDDAAIGPGHLDYALIRLATCPPTTPRGLPVAPEAFPARPEERSVVYLFQHPRGAPIRVAHGPFAARDGQLLRDGLNVNALPGSSGGPYTDRSFRVFAQHQGGNRRPELLPGLGDAVNVAVPITAILRDIGPWPPMGVNPRVHVVTGPFGRQPLIGRAATRAWVARALQPEGPRILVVKSGTGETGLGCSFTAAILTAILPEDEHLVLRLGAAQGWHAMAPERFCETLLGVAAGAAPLRSLEQAATSRDRWLTGPLLDDLRAAMRARLRVAEGQSRLFWLVLDDLDKTEIPEGEGLREFLMALYEEAARSDWLRIALLGYRGPPLDPARHRSETEELWPLTPDTIEAWLTELDRHLEAPDTPAAADMNRELARKAMRAQLMFDEARSRTEAVARFLRLMVEKQLLAREG